MILSSLDSYHSSNLIRQDNRGNREPICRNAEYIVHRDEYDAVMSASKSTARVYHNIKGDLKVLQDKLRASGDEIRIFDGDELKIGEFVTVVRHGGATNGYCSVYVKVYSETIVISGPVFPNGLPPRPWYSTRRQLQSSRDLRSERAVTQRVLGEPGTSCTSRLTRGLQLGTCNRRAVAGRWRKSATFFTSPYLSLHKRSTRNCRTTAGPTEAGNRQGGTNMTTQHFETGKASFGLSKGPGRRVAG